MDTTPLQSHPSALMGPTASSGATESSGSDSCASHELITIQSATDLPRGCDFIGRLPSLYLLSISHVDGTLLGIRWPFGQGDHDSFHGMAKRRGAHWTGEYWKFKNAVDAQKVFDEIRKRHPSWPVLQQLTGEGRTEILKGVMVSSWNLTAGTSACLIPHPLPRSTDVQGIGNASRITKVLLQGRRPAEHAALLFGPAEQIQVIVNGLQAQGAKLSDSLAVRWGMGAAVSLDKVTVRSSGWALEIQCDLRDPRHYCLKPKLLLGWTSDDLGQRRFGPIPWHGTLSITRSKWLKCKDKLDAAGLTFEGDDPDAQDRAPLNFDPSAVCGWLEPAPNGFLLHGYQKEGVVFCMARGMRALIGDEMGIGKTAQAIAAADACGARRIVIVCPANARFVWEREIQGWSRKGSIQHLSSKSDSMDPTARWHIVTYDVLVTKAQPWKIVNEQEEAALINAIPSLKKGIKASKKKGYPKSVSFESVPDASPKFSDPWQVAAWEKMKQRFDNQLLKEIIGAKDILLIADEAHRMKNKESKRSQAVAQVAANGCNLLLLTGTILRNNEHDAAALLALLDPRAAYDLDPAKGYTIQDIKSYLNFFMIRRTKEQVLPNLPPKTRQRIDIDELAPEAMNDYLERIVTAYESHERAIAEGKSQAQAREAALGHLESARKFLGLAKVDGGVVADFVVDVVENKECCVVFTAHHDVSDRLAEQLADVGLRVAVVDGRTSQRKRDKIVQAFQNGELDVFIGTIKAAGESITLARANTVIFVELDWVPMALVQAEDRIHRESQKQNCQVVHLIARLPGYNLDEVMIAMIASKIARIDAVLDEDTEDIISSEGVLKTEVLKHLLETALSKLARPKSNDQDTGPDLAAAP